MSLKYRIAVVIFLLEAVMMSIVFYTTVSRSQEINQNQLEINERVILDLLGDLSRLALFTFEYDNLQTYIEKIAEDPHVVKVLIIDRNRRVAASSNVNDIGKSAPELKDTSYEYWLLKEVKNASGVLGSVAVNYSQAELIAAKKEVLFLGVRVALVGMTIIAVVGVLTGYLLTRRLEVLSDAAQRIKEGHLDVQTNLAGRDELALLGQTFDGMVTSFKVSVDKLRSGENELRKARDELEDRVDERTMELATANKELERLAMHDPLTNLPNRALLLLRLQQAIEGSQRNHSMFAMLMMDLDRFKEVNDTLGHDVGDELLVQVSHRVGTLLRKSDTVARIGGDEFAIVLSDVTQEQAILISGKIGRCLSSEFEVANHKFNIGCSIGIAMFPEHGVDSSVLLKCADLAMYVAKRNHLNHVVYDAAESPQSESVLSLDSSLRQAIEQDELLLHYQPKVDLQTGSLIGVEALVRWQHDDHLLYPDKFIPYAEKTGLIKNITKWVLKTALKQQSQWQSVGENLKMSVNLSFKDLGDHSLVSYISESLDRWQVNPECLMLEITETSVMEDPHQTLEILRQLDEMGLGISIDDFGTGYSSLVYLKKLPVDEIKIDRSFVVDLLSNSDSLVIVRSIIDLAHNLGMSVTAEGVETMEVWEKLSSLGCDVSQGYYSGPPMSSEDLVRSPFFTAPLTVAGK
ncbi:MAG: EAL domain-containing protein [Desulfobacterales bacterium]|nr:EAL domain-containing protein [Desulfobacterales bacterium]